MPSITRPPAFTAADFTPTPWDTAADKAKFANHFLRFVQRGFPPALFHRWFYRRLSNTFGHIAHFDAAGFFRHFFASPAGKVAFLEQTLQWGCYGRPTHTYCDVERALQARLVALGVLAQWRSHHAEAQDRVERMQLARLLAKYYGNDLFMPKG